jgi:hypothetical protein
VSAIDEFPEHAACVRVSLKNASPPLYNAKTTPWDDMMGKLKFPGLDVIAVLSPHGDAL